MRRGGGILTCEAGRPSRGFELWMDLSHRQERIDLEGREQEVRGLMGKQFDDIFQRKPGLWMAGHERGSGDCVSPAAG